MAAPSTSCAVSPDGKSRRCSPLEKKFNFYDHNFSGDLRHSVRLSMLAPAALGIAGNLFLIADIRRACQSFLVAADAVGGDGRGIIFGGCGGKEIGLAYNF